MTDERILHAIGDSLRAARRLLLVVGDDQYSDMVDDLTEMMIAVSEDAERRAGAPIRTSHVNLDELVRDVQRRTRDE
jgi:hypothetical protein